MKSYFVPHPPRTPAGIACVRFEWLGGAVSPHANQKAVTRPNLGRVARQQQPLDPF